MVTIQMIQDSLAAQGKIVKRNSVYTYLNALDIHPIGARQKPQLFPADTAERILAHLGFNGNGHKRTGILSLKEIKRRAGKAAK